MYVAVDRHGISSWLTSGVALPETSCGGSHAGGFGSAPGTSGPPVRLPARFPDFLPFPDSSAEPE